MSDRLERRLNVIGTIGRTAKAWGADQAIGMHVSAALPGPGITRLTNTTCTRFFRVSRI